MCYIKDNAVCSCGEWKPKDITKGGSMVCDVRNWNKEEPDEILFSDDVKIVRSIMVGHLAIVNEELDKAVGISLLDIDNMILALQKAKEIWCE